MKIAATYHRVSRDREVFGDEDVAVFNLVDQLALERGPIYVDNPSAVRLAFDRMLDDARMFRFQVLIVARVEHLRRSPREAEQLRDQLKRLGIEILALELPDAPARRLGRPPADINVHHARELQRQGKTFKQIADELGVGIGTVHRAIGKSRRRRRRADLEIARPYTAPEHAAAAP